MGVHSSPIVAKRLWKMLRITFFMIRKGLISKRSKMLMDMNLMMKKGKLLRKSLSNLMSSSKSAPRGRSGGGGGGGFGVHDYEFSCSNSPNPVFLHMPKRNNKHYYHFNFPCIQAPNVFEGSPPIEVLDVESSNVNVATKAVVTTVPKTPEYMFNLRFEFDYASEFAAGERKSPILSPFSVRISNYSALEENNEEVGNNGGTQVDDLAEDFIRRFHEQLRTQSRMQLLQYQDM